MTKRRSTGPGIRDTTNTFASRQHGRRSSRQARDEWRRSSSPITRRQGMSAALSSSNAHCWSIVFLQRQPPDERSTRAAAWPENNNAEEAIVADGAIASTRFAYRENVCSGRSPRSSDGESRKPHHSSTSPVMSRGPGDSPVPAPSRWLAPTSPAHVPACSRRRSADRAVRYRQCWPIRLPKRREDPKRLQTRHHSAGIVQFRAERWHESDDYRIVN